MQEIAKAIQGLTAHLDEVRSFISEVGGLNDDIEDTAAMEARARALLDVGEGHKSGWAVMSKRMRALL